MTKRHWPGNPQTPEWMLSASEWVRIAWAQGERLHNAADYNLRVDPLVWGVINVNPRTHEVTGRI